ncbi:hypothetical protein [Novosphingobium resinovorum]|uniref:hypothetical protein n=1 Tax=Novosphingobium resinovorum TaxID=158500 RepID=UPI002ED55F52|nr:hypothetical protein [Novosphingobium resinovorum]
MIDAGLREALTAFDDAALATLANPGLVRRAHRDVSEGKVRLLSAEPGKVEIEADGQRVSLDGRGPKMAGCACRALAVCRHRIAAVLFVQAQATESAAEEQQPPADLRADPGEILGGIALDRLEKWTGKAGWRAALELSGEATGVEAAGNALLVTFAEIDGPVRILKGQGPEGVVSKVSRSRIKAYHGAAILAARRHFGLSLPAIPAEAQEAQAGEGARQVDPAFLARVAAGLRETAVLGMNLAPLPLEESLFALSVSSRADMLSRLAALLRAIAAQMRLRRKRALDFDPDRMLELTATAFALVRALSGSDGAALAGKVRRDYVPVEALQLIGCGGERWTSTTGARGVTAWFLEPGSGRWLSTSLARGAAQDPGFNPRDAWQLHPLWQSEPLATLSHARIELEGSRRSADHRLSAPASAKARIVARSVSPQADWPGVVHDWPSLRRRWLDEVGLGLDGAEVPTACLIAPTEVAAPFFDELAQQLVWPVRDEAGHWLGLTLDHEDGVSSAIDVLEANVKSGWRGLVLVRIERSGARLAVRPITLHGPEGAIDLSFWSPPLQQGGSGAGEGGRMRNWLARLRSSQTRRFTQVPPSGTEAALGRAWRHLLDRAEIGPALARTLDADLTAHALRLDTYGLAHLARILRKVTQDGQEAEGLLVATYALLLARRQRCMVPLLR